MDFKTKASILLIAGAFAAIAITWIAYPMVENEDSKWFRVIAKAILITLPILATAAAIYEVGFAL